MSTETTATTDRAATRWPWRMKTTYKDGTTREDDWADEVDAVGLAKFKSEQAAVERVELTTVFTAGQQVSPQTVDMVIPWSEVRTGDQALNYHGQLEEATVMPQGNAWCPEGCVSVMLGGSWYTPRKDKLTAVRRPITR